MEHQPGHRVRIDEEALVKFVREQIRLVSETPLPEGLAKELDGTSALNLDAVWLGAGLATQIGLPILERPEVFLGRE